MNKTAMHICVFSSGLEDLSSRRQRDPIAVLAALAANPRFSVFEVNNALAKQLDKLAADELIDYNPKDTYPWCDVTITARGWRKLRTAHR